MTATALASLALIGVVIAVVYLYRNRNGFRTNLSQQVGQKPRARVPDSKKLSMSDRREGICILSPAGEIVDCNDALGEILGIPTGKLHGCTAKDVLPEALLVQIDAQRTTHLRKGGASDTEDTNTGTDTEDTEAFLENTQRNVVIGIKALGNGDADSSLLLSITDITGHHNELAHASAMVNARIESEEQSPERSTTDPLTGLGSRGQLHDTLTSRLSEKDTTSAGLIMVDIDHFKTINETHGHAAGDAVLVRVAQAMSETCRDKDLIVRWGGEEFVVLLHESDARRLELAAERLRLQIRRLVIELDNGIALQITVSIGAALIEPSQTSTSALQQVDRLLYAAKQEGRDRVKSNRDSLL